LIEESLLAGKSKPAGPVRETFDPVGGFDSMKGWKRGIAAAVILMAVITILVPELVFLDNVIIAPDTKAPMSFRVVARTSLESGTYPLWNPYLFCGMPSFSSLAYTPYVYPVSYITHILHKYGGFPAMGWLLLHYLLAGAGMYLLARSFGMRPSISLLAGILFMMMPNFVAAGANGHGSQAGAVAWMPLALLFARGVLGVRRRIDSAAFLAIVLGMQMLRGHIQISYYTFLLIGLFYIFEMVGQIREGKGREALAGTGLLAASFVLALGIAAVLVFPVRDYADWSIRGGNGGGLDYDYATGWSLHPKEILTFILPWSFGFGKVTYWGRMPFTDYPNYIGQVTALFSILGIFILRGRVKWFLLTAAVLATLISFGRFFPVLYDPLFRFLPWFDKFRVPVMILIVQQLVLVVLAGLTMEELLRRAGQGALPGWLTADRLKWILIAFAAVLVILLVAGGSIRSGIESDPMVKARVKGEWSAFAAGRYSADLARSLFFLLLSAGAVFVLVRGRIRYGLVIGAVALIGIVDLMTVDHSIVKPEKTWRSSNYRLIRPLSEKEGLATPNETSAWLSGREGMFRVFPVPSTRPGGWSHNVFPFSDNSYMMSGVFSMGGYHAAKLKNYQDVMDAMFGVFNSGGMPLPVLNMLNARYFHSLFPIFREDSPFPLVFEGKDSYVYENPYALPRVFMTGGCGVMTHGEILTAISRQDFDPASMTLLEKAPAVFPESNEGSTAEIVSYGLNAIKIKAHVEKPCIMVLSEIDYPDWIATVGGEEREILTANYCLRALPLEAGDHDIVFEYRSSVIRKSLVLSVVSLIFAVAMAVIPGVIAGRKG
jgi:hypothetical protein